MPEGIVAVTGGLGFVGTHLCRALTARGFRVRCIDRVSGSYATGSGPAAWAGASTLRQVSVIHADVGRGSLEPLLEGAAAVIHLAALPGVRTQHEPSELWQQNVANTARLAAEAARAGRRFVLASTSSVYGAARALPSGERAVPAPLNPYAASKLAAEKVCLRLAAGAGADAVVARLFTVYGPGQRPDMAFARWIDAMLAGEAVEWCAPAGAARDFTYAVDAAAGLAAALEHGRAGQVYNVAGHGPVPLDRALGVLERLLGRRALLRRQTPPAEEAVVTSGCGRKAALELGYRPSVSLEEGLRRQVAHACGRGPQDGAACAAPSPARAAPVTLLAGPAGGGG